MQYTSRCQGISMGSSMELAERDHSGCGGSLRYGIFSRSLTSCAEVAKPMGWTIHSTFNDISPGARDEEVRRVTVRRLRQAVSLAPLFRPLGIVMHGGYSDWLFDFDGEAWLAGAKRTFSEVAEAAERAGVDIYIENVFDEVPDHLLRLRAAVGSKRLGFCFDAGAATPFSRLPAQKWTEAVCPGPR